METKPILFLATTQPEKSRQFYENVLDWNFVTDEPFALVFSAYDLMIRIQKVEEFEPQDFTVFGLEVEDIVSEIKELKSKGVTIEKYAFLDQDENGIWKTDDNTKICWFKDPDNNLLSLTEL